MITQINTPVGNYYKIDEASVSEEAYNKEYDGIVKNPAVISQRRFSNLCGAIGCVEEINHWVQQVPSGSMTRRAE